MKKLTVLTVAVLMTFASNAQTFTQGDIAVFVTASNSNNTTGRIVELNTSTANQSGVYTYNINGTSGPNALRFKGSDKTANYLANSNDGTLLCFTGHNSTATAGDAAGIPARGVGTLNSSYAFNLATTYTGMGGKDVMDATSLNNSTWYIGDEGGIYSNGTTSPSPVGKNVRSIKSFGGKIYVLQVYGSVPAVSTLSAPTGGMLTGLPGLANGGTSPSDFYLVSSGSNGSTYDVLYVAGQSNHGQIFKYSLVSGSWIANGSYTSAIDYHGFWGLAASTGGGGAYLYASTGEGNTSANRVLKINDLAGYNSNININVGNIITLYTAAAYTTVKGIAFAPVSGCTPPSLLSVSSNSPVCSGTNLNLAASASGTAAITYSWAGPNSFTSALPNPVITAATLAAGGTYTVTVTNSCGNATATKSITVKSSTSSSQSTTACNSYVWNGATYTGSGDKTYSTTNAAGCDSTIVLHLIINNSNSGGTESATACNSYLWNGTAYTTSGDETRLFAGGSVAGCDSLATLHLTINSSASGSSESATACNSYGWNGTTYTNSGDKTYSTTNITGCDSTAILHLTINVLLTPVISGSSSFCAGSSTTLSSDNYISYIWSPGGQTTREINVQIPGDYAVTVTDANGCTDSSSVLTVTIRVIVSDFDSNSIVDINDFNLFIPKFGFGCAGCPEDLNRDGFVDVNDFNIFVVDFGKTCP